VRRPADCKVIDPVTGETIRTIPGRAYSPSTAKFVRKVMTREALERVVTSAELPECLKIAAEASLGQLSGEAPTPPAPVDKNA
jgi:hypothetical protein